MSEPRKAFVKVTQRLITNTSVVERRLISRAEIFVADEAAMIALVNTLRTLTWPKSFEVDVGWSQYE